MVKVIFTLTTAATTMLGQICDTQKPVEKPQVKKEILQKESLQKELPTGTKELPSC